MRKKDVKEYTALKFDAKSLGFVKAATSKNSPRAAFTCGHLVVMRGCLWLIATDTHRLHGLRVADNADGVKMMDGKNRVEAVDIHLLQTIAKIKGWAGLSFEYSETGVHLFGYDKSGSPALVPREFWAMADNSVGATPPIDKVVPTEFPDTPQKGLTFNYKYLAQCDMGAYNNQVFLHSSGENRASLILATKEPPEDISRHSMFAVVMPMSK